jgi:hypothetical protein
MKKAVLNNEAGSNALMAALIKGSLYFEGHPSKKPCAPPLPGEARSSPTRASGPTNASETPNSSDAGCLDCSFIVACPFVLADATAHSQSGATRLDHGIVGVEGVSFWAGLLERLHLPRFHYPNMRGIATCRANASARAEVVNQPPANRNLSHKRLIEDARGFPFPATYKHPAKARVVLGSSEFPATRLGLHCHFALQPLSELFTHKTAIL